MNSASDAFQAAAGKLGNVATAAEVQQIVTPFANALTTFDSHLLKANWPPAVATDVIGLVTAEGAEIGDLDSAWSQNILSEASWKSALTGDAAKGGTAADIVRADLGPPPPKP